MRAERLFAAEPRRGRRTHMRVRQPCLAPPHSYRRSVPGFTSALSVRYRARHVRHVLLPRTELGAGDLAARTDDSEGQNKEPAPMRQVTGDVGHDPNNRRVLERPRALPYNYRARMRRLLSKADMQGLALLMVFVLFLATIPLTSGVVVVSGPTHPEFTINICHPIQAFEAASNSLLAPPAAAVHRFVLACVGSVTLCEPARIIEHRTEPETPPPKPLA